MAATPSKAPKSLNGITLKGDPTRTALGGDAGIELVRLWDQPRLFWHKSNDDDAFSTKGMMILFALTETKNVCTQAGREFSGTRR